MLQYFLDVCTLWLCSLFRKCGVGRGVDITFRVSLIINVILRMSGTTYYHVFILTRTKLFCILNLTITAYATVNVCCCFFNLFVSDESSVLRLCDRQSVF